MNVIDAPAEARVLITAVAKGDSVRENALSDLTARLLARCVCATQEDAEETQFDLASVLFHLARLADVALATTDELCEAPAGSARSRLFGKLARAR